MRNQSYTDWLEARRYASRLALIGAYEYRDKLLYIDAPELRKRYMDTFGAAEDEVLKTELEVSLLYRKIELIQMAKNRQAVIDLEAIETQLEGERAELIAEAEQTDMTLQALPELTPEEKRLLQQDFRCIVESFHPAVNKNVTKEQVELYNRAVNAYKMQNVQALQQIFYMLFPSDSPQNVQQFAAQIDKWENAANDREIGVDYTLAGKLYPCYAATEAEQILLGEIERFNVTRADVEKQTETILAGFPFNALDTLEDPQKTKEYLAGLGYRKYRSEEEKAELEQRISQMMEGT